MGNGLTLKKRAARSEGPNEMDVRTMERGPKFTKAKSTGPGQMNTPHVLEIRERKLKEKLKRMNQE